MNITDYTAHIESLIDSFPIITSSTVNIDRKSEDIAFISGQIDFVDGSVMDFKEFIENTETGLEKYKYGYNYRIESEVIFRYDNAPDPRARGLKTFPHHKHTKDGKIIESGHKTLSDVLEEIEEIVLNRLVQADLESEK